MASDYTPSGIRRSGDYYQDLVAIETILDFLGNKQNYKYIMVEAPEMGSLDDVVAVRKDDSLDLKQVKFSGHADDTKDQWTWEKLTIKKGKQGSLIEKWADSIQDIKKKHIIHSASVETNRRSDEILRSLDSHNHVLFENLDQTLKKKLVEQIGSKELAEDFFAIFCFNLNRPNIDDFEGILKRRFFKFELTESDWKSLKDKVESWIRKKERPEPDGKITYEVIQDAVNWHILQKLDEKFPIPSDFVIPSEKFHSMLLAELNKMRSGCTVIIAPPGMGKSTYLSFLYDHLEEIGLPIIRHHYYLSERDGTIGRCNPENIAESLMNEIKVKYPESLGSLRFNNADFNDLSTWLAKSGEFFSKLEKALYVIIDGLDHVWQESQPTNGLERLFEHIFPTANGIVVIIGTQPISDEKIPCRLLQVSPREKWLQLPPLDIKAMKQWVRNHANIISLPDDTLQRNNILDMLAQDFHKKTGGFPLYLRFALNLIEDEKREINYNTVDSLPDFAQNGVLGYYKLLLQNLPEEQKQILYLLTVCSFPLKQNEIVECLEPKIALTTIISSIRRTKYLLKEDFVGLTLFHNSLSVFLQQQSDYPEYANMLRHLISDWVDNKAPDFLKQQYSWIVKAELGDNEPLISGPNRKWVIQAVMNLFPRNGISQVLSKSALAALKNRDFERVIEVSFLLDYYNTIFEYWPESLENLIYSQLAINDKAHLNRSIVFDISLLTPKQLLLLSENNSAEQELVNNYFNELDERQKGNRYDKYRGNFERQESLLNSFIGTAALLDQDSFLQFINRLLKVKDPERATAIEVLCQALRKNKKSSRLRELLGLPFSSKELYIILQYAILLSFEEGFDLSTEVLVNSKHPFAAIYASINELGDYSTSLITFPSAVVFESMKDNPYSKEFNVSRTLYDSFLFFLQTIFGNVVIEMINGLKNCQMSG